MYPTTDAFRLAVKQSHTVSTRVEVWSGSQKLFNLDVSTGSVDVSTDSAVRRSCTVEFHQSRSDNTLVPDTAFDAITPYGNELRLYRGILFTDGSEELIPLGVFVITKVAIADKDDGVTVTLSGSDRSVRVTRNKWLSPYSVSAGSLTTALTGLLQDRWAGIDISFPTIADQVSPQVLGQDNSSDPWKDAVLLAEVCGYDLFFNQNGQCTLRQFPDLDAATVSDSYTEGEDGVIVSLEREDSTEDTVNGIVYITESSWALTPFRIEVWDEDPNSPTYRYGNFGQVPKIVSQSAVTDQSQAVTAATALLARELGRSQAVSWEQIPDPALDAFDVLSVTNTGAKVSRTLIVDKISLPLESSAMMRVTARTVKVV